MSYADLERAEVAARGTMACEILGSPSPLRRNDRRLLANVDWRMAGAAPLVVLLLVLLLS